MTKEKLLKLVFHKDTLALIASLLFLWFTIGLIVDKNYHFQDLNKHNGKIVKIDSVIVKIKNKPFFKEITKELRLSIDKGETYFTTLTTKDFGYITTNIFIGDTVDIYTKTRLWGIFGMKQERNLSHLTKGSKVLIDYDGYKKSLSGIYILTLIVSIGFFIFYFVRLKRRNVFGTKNKL